VLFGVVADVWNDSVSECRSSVYGKSSVCRYRMDGDVKEVHVVVCLSFHCELECRLYCEEVCQYVLGVCVIGVVDDQYVGKISEDFYDLMFV
jgi:hypothetical protein